MRFKRYVLSILSTDSGLNASQPPERKEANPRIKAASGEGSKCLADFGKKLSLEERNIDELRCLRKDCANCSAGLASRVTDLTTLKIHHQLVRRTDGQFSGFRHRPGECLTQKAS